MWKKMYVPQITELDLLGESNLKLIAHRGLTTGPDANLENRPEQIKLALKQGYDCEIDVWFDIHSGWSLGHDGPDYVIEFDFLEQPGLWLHAKNLEALHVLGAGNKLNFFWHQSDDFTLTSQGHIWTYPGKELTYNSVMVMPEWHDPEFKKISTASCYAICSDYVEKIKPIFQS